MEMITKFVAFFQGAHLDAWAVALLLCVEAFLGKTELVAPGSTLEAAFMSVKKVLEFVSSMFKPKAG